MHKLGRRDGYKVKYALHTMQQIIRIRHIGVQAAASSTASGILPFYENPLNYRQNRAKLIQYEFFRVTYF